jgi:hypothetical protein
LKEITVRKEKDEEERKATMEDLKSLNTMADAFATYFPIIAEGFKTPAASAAGIIGQMNVK